MTRTIHREFDSLRIEGGIFPGEFLNAVRELKLKGQGSTDYGLHRTLKLRDEISRYWRIAKAEWEVFNEARQRQDTDRTALAVERFLVPLLQHVFAFTDLQSCRNPRYLGERRFPLTHEAGFVEQDLADSGFALGENVSREPRRIAHIPLVLTSPDFSLDKSHPAFGDEGRRRSPQGLLQEYLNASPEALWGIVSNGLVLRILRDNPSMTRPAFVEVDLARLFEDDLYSDFVALWLTLHASRFLSQNGKTAQCWLEQWRAQAAIEGERAQEKLRAGVEEALRSLGGGFVAHPANQSLREALSSGELSPNAFFQQLLRLVYRLLFLLTAEDRDILHDPATASTEARRLYAQGYSLSLLRERARKRRFYDDYSDLWQALSTTFTALRNGQPLLGLPALGGLFTEDQCPQLDVAQLGNRALLTAIRAVTWVQRKTGATRINYRDMDTEELGSVYESLLELIPRVNPATSPWQFGFIGDAEGESDQGNARKTSGSYYTSDSLVQELIKSALLPVIDQRLKANPEQPRSALLSIKVCDPACGSGHFLLAAARRLAANVAELDAQGDQYTQEQYRHALREVVLHCIYGVDRNPMAIELCKVALWLEAIEPGKPLGFLDPHVRCGDALIGVHDLTVLREGIPDEAFSPLKDVLADTGHIGECLDNKEAAKAIRKRNAAERKTPILPLAGLNLGIPEDLNAAITALSADEDSLADVYEKRRLYEQARADNTLTGRLLHACDLWTAAFFSVKRQVNRVGLESTPTSDTVWRYLSAPESLPAHVAEEVDSLRRQYSFFHWPLEFPEVFRDGGFDLVLGNPPWETMSPDAKEYFSKHSAAISGMAPDKQKAYIAELLGNVNIRDGWERHARELYAVVRFIKESGRYRLFAEGNLGKGDFNVYRQFVELALSFTAPDGFAAQIVPENFYNGANAAAIRQEIFESYSVVALYGFENARGVWFEGIDTRMKFVLYSARRGGITTEIPVAFSLSSVAALQELPKRTLMLPLALVHEFSPDALAIMEFSNQLEIDIARQMYSKFPKLGEEVKGSPYWQPLRELDMGNDNRLFSTDLAGWPLYQGSMVTHHDYRAKGYVSGHGRNVLWQELKFGSANKCIHPQWRVLEEDIPGKISGRVKRYRVGFCDVARADDRRSLMAALIPPFVVCGDKVPTIEFEPRAPEVMMLWLAVANSLAMDFIVRMKVSLKVSMSLLASLPFPRQVSQSHASAKSVALAARLSCAGPEMADFLHELATHPTMADYDLTPSEDPHERARLMAELDVVVARDLFGLDRCQMAYLLEPRDVLGLDCRAETFAALRRAEEREFGEYRTRRLVLEAWDKSEKSNLH